MLLSVIIPDYIWNGRYDHIYGVNSRIQLAYWTMEIMDKSILDLRLGKVAKEILKTKTEKMVSHHKRINIDHVTSDVTLYCILIMINENKSSKKKTAFW